jgi:hypothetical protein
MVLYELSDNSAFERVWTSAVSIRPTSHVVNWECSQCGRGDCYPAGSFDVDVEEGSMFPDLLRCGAYPLLVVSARTIAAFEDAGIQSFLKYPVGIAGVRESGVRMEAAPDYYRIEIAGECMVDLARTGIVITDVCSRCGEVEREPPTVRPFSIFAGSWDGADVFRDHRFFPRVCFCTQKVVDLVNAHGLTNFRFRQLK